MIIWKLLAEIFFAITSFGSGYSFWSSIKSHKFLNSTLSDQAELVKLLTFIGTENIKDESREIKKEHEAPNYEKLIPQAVSKRMKAIGFTRNLAGMLFLIVLILSFIISLFLPIINAGFFLLSHLLGISDANKYDLETDIQSAMIGIYCWHQKDPEKCKYFCLYQQTRFAAIYRTVISEIK